MKKEDKPIIAIRKYCLSCSGGVKREVESCDMKSCDLYPYRNGKKTVNANESK